MHRFLTSLVLAAALAVAPAAPADDVVEPSPAALAFAGTFSDDHLSGMLSRIGSRQPPLVALSQLHGNLLAAIFDAEIDAAVTKYGPQWRENMAIAWMPLLTTEELESLTANAADSPYGEKYRGLRVEAGTSMGALSGELFASILAEVIRNTVNALAAPAEAAPKE